MKKLIITSICTLGLTLLCAFGNYQNSFFGLNADENIANAMQNIQTTQQNPVSKNALPVTTYATLNKTVDKAVATQLSTKKQNIACKKATKKVKKVKKNNTSILSYDNVDLTKCKSAKEVVQKLQNNGYTNITLSNINDISSLKNILAQVNKNCPKSTSIPAPTTKPTTKPAPTAKPTTVPSTTPAPTTKPVPTATPAPTSNNSDLSAYANQVLQIVNQERAKAGLPALTTNTTITAAANKRAQEIAQSFSHTRPNGSSFYTVLKEFGVSYRSAGENIAYGQRTPQEVMNGWMNSAGHRANILNSGYGKIGIGVYKVNGVIYWTQEFTN